MSLLNSEWGFDSLTPGHIKTFYQSYSAVPPDGTIVECFYMPLWTNW